MTTKASWNGQVIAESDDIVMVEGNAYFPFSSVKKELLTDSKTHTRCHWKGLASYCSIDINGNVNEDAAWYYPEPLDGAEMIKDRVAFWRGVEISED